MTKYRAQAKNANKHTAKGKQLLSESIQRDGYIGAVTVAADGETFAGSARLELGKDAFENAIEIHTNGEPVVIVRDDIPNADDPKAKRLGVADNVVHGLDWEPDAAILAAIANDDEIVKRLVDEDYRLRALLNQDAPIDYKDVWKGMPEFNQGDKKPFRSITVHFENQKDVEDFSRVINQAITDKTKWLWFPVTVRENLKSLVYES